MACQGNSEYRFGDRLVNLLADPREENNLIEDYPEVSYKKKGGNGSEIKCVRA